MSKWVLCKTITSGLGANRYRSKKGNQYLFEMGCPTRIDDDEDADYFINNESFEEITVKDKVKETAKKIVEKVKDSLTSEKKKEDNSREAYKKEYEEIKALNKKEQVVEIGKLAGTSHIIPHLEAGRIKLIMKLRKEKGGK